MKYIFILTSFITCFWCNDVYAKLNDLYVIDCVNMVTEGGLKSGIKHNRKNVINYCECIINYGAYDNGISMTQEHYCDDLFLAKKRKYTKMAEEVKNAFKSLITINNIELYKTCKKELSEKLKEDNLDSKQQKIEDELFSCICDGLVKQSKDVYIWNKNKHFKSVEMSILEMEYTGSCALKSIRNQEDGTNQ